MAQTNVDLTSHGHGTCKRADQGDVDQGDQGDQGDVDQGDVDQGDTRLHVYARAQDCRANFNCRVDALFNCAGRASLCKCVAEKGVFRKFWTECPFSVFSVNYPPYLHPYTSINY